MTVELGEGFRLRYVFWNDETGYGIAAKQYMRAMEESRIDYIQAPMRKGRKYGLGYEPDPSPGWSMNSTRLILHTVPEYYNHLLADLPEQADGRFGFTIW